MSDATTRRGIALRDWIRRELSERGWSQRQLATRSGLAAAALNDLLNDESRVPRPATIRKLEKALGPAPAAAQDASEAGGFQVLEQTDFSRLKPPEAFASIAALLRTHPERWQAVLYRRTTGTGQFPIAKPELLLIDALERLESGDIVAVRSPLGDGLRMLADPYLMGPATGIDGFEIRGSVGVTVLGKVALSVMIYET